MRKITTPKYSCIILDDDRSAVEILKHYLRQIDKLTLTSTFTDPIAAAAAFNTYQMIDFLFLDISMEVSGLDLARMLRKKVRYIIFVTAYKDFALEAFENGDAYLVKPVDFATLLRSINYLIAKSKNQARLGKVPLD
ncbi:LytR/AlgR family response regulator transcription factor [Pedobacter aquatilis]|uniref:LytR/AlgR family response regulator transcription factor n=1 Tax=Pedobacter aquatilis TaxID=351343 RepID=UPI00292E9C91|nr:response regulator [Pedobacter aquatilis]